MIYFGYFRLFNLRFQFNFTIARGVLSQVEQRGAKRQREEGPTPENYSNTRITQNTRYTHFWPTQIPDHRHPTRPANVAEFVS